MGGGGRGLVINVIWKTLLSSHLEMNSPISHISILFLQNDQPPINVVIETALPFNHSVSKNPYLF